MLEAGIVTVCVFVVWLIVRMADRWGDRETYTAETWAAVEAWQAVKREQHFETRQHVKEKVGP